MVRYLSVLVKVLARTNIHSGIHLPGIGRQDLRIAQFPCELHRVAGLAGGGGAEDADEVDVPVGIGLRKGGDVDGFGLGHRRHRRNAGPVREEVCLVGQGHGAIKNRRASFDYEFLETYTAGIQLVGTEIKSIRAGKASLQDAYCFFVGNQLFVRGMNIAQYHWGSWGQHEPVRDRRLLLTRKELNHLLMEDKKTGLTIVAVKLFIADNGYAKLLIALAKGKKEYDKRNTIKERDVRREMDRGDY